MTETPATPSVSSPSDRHHDFQARLLAETLRCLEESQQTSDETAEVDAQVREAGGDFEQRIIHRALLLPISSELQQGLDQLRRTVFLSLIVAVLGALAAGLLAGLTALGSGEQANVFWVLGSLLSVPTLTLLLWFLVGWLHPSSLSSGTLGSVVLGVARRLDHWLHKGPVTWAATRASVTVLSSSPLGRWLLSAITHCLWTVFLSGCVLMLVAVLALRQYDFYWETTILSEQSYVVLTHTLAWLPEQLGFSTPGVAEIQASRLEGGAPEFDGAAIPWSGFLIGSLVVYGLFPRLLLLGFSLLLLRREQRRYRLDTALPGFERLRPRLMPVATSLGVVDPDPGELPRQPAPQVPVEVGNGPVGLVGIEIDLPTCGWPIPAGDTLWWDLGIINSREDHRRVLQQLQQATPPPALLVVVCSLLSTPDRGIRNQLLRLSRESNTPLGLILSDGQRLRERRMADTSSQRIQHWRELADSLGIDSSRVTTVDLNHLTAASQALLARLAGNQASNRASARVGLPGAFQLIVEHLADWQGPPEAARQAALHQAILEHYQGEGHSWPTFIRTSIDPRKINEELRDAASQLVNRLPARLRNSPRWLATGAMTGAFSCLAAASLLAPAAIAGLPLWAGLGAAIAVAIRPDAPPPTEHSEAADLGEAVASAALFAVLLDLQSLPEEHIDSILDGLLDDQPPYIDNPSAAADWLDGLADRLSRLRAEHAP